MPRLALVLSIALAACTAAPTTAVTTPAPTREPNTFAVTALLDLSGARAPSGQPQRNAMQIWLDQNTGASALKMRVKFVDVASSDAKLLLELRRAAVDDRADAVVVGVPITLDGSFADAVQVARIPVLVTTPVREPVGAAGGGSIFALAPAPETIARALANDIVDRGLLAPMLLASDETTAAVVERLAFVAELKRRGFTAPSPLSLAEPDAARRVASAAAVAKSVVFFGASAPHGDEVRAIALPGAPLVYLSYLTETADVTNLRDQRTIVTWPASRELGVLSFAGTNARFLQTFVDRYGPPSTLAASAFDALALIDAAAQRSPSELDSSLLRQRLEATTLRGVAARYSFTPTRHVGFPTDTLTFLQWDAVAGLPMVAPGPRGSDR